MRLGVYSAMLLVLGLPTAVSASELNALQEAQRLKLGELLFTDVNLSINRNQSCASCHDISTHAVPTQRDPDNPRLRLTHQAVPSFIDTANQTDGSAVSDGSIDRQFGKLNSPSVAYAAFSPTFHWDADEELFFGGMFWNGRASSLQEQAKEPFLDPIEMAMPSEWSVIERLQEAKGYRRLFGWVYGLELGLVQEGDPEVETVFDAVADAISAFERSSRFARFDSKFDFEAAGMVSYNESEQRGADLFDAEALCGECHTTEGIDGDGTPALLTDFSYDNLGTPANPFIPGNPDPDIGLQGNPNLVAARGEISSIDEVEGRHKVMSLRNIALTAPYMHNGVFKTLQEVVHFYNTRDVLPTCENPADASNPGFGVSCWPEGEFHATRNVDELGDLGLSVQDEADIVAYLKTFTDGYPIWGNRNGLHDVNIPADTPSPFADFPVPDNSHQ